MVLITILEFIAGHLIYSIIKEPFWDYSKLKYNLGKYIALEISLIWGVMATFINYIIIPKIKNKLERVPKVLTYFLLTTFIIDLILTIIKR
jgi:uncharacterized membrane protein